ncbi:MAG: PhoH family protein [Erysipelotrichaceae bacterium]|nr:PhoH family protein [Erysipelotrichaceae bacterium]
MKPVKQWDFVDLKSDETVKLFGINDQYLKLCEEILDVSLSLRDNKLSVLSGDKLKAEQVIELFKTILSDIRADKIVDERDFRYLAGSLRPKTMPEFAKERQKPLGKTYSGRLIYPKTAGQARFIQAMNEHDMLFAIGPAGTGKTYLSVVYACTLLRNGEINKIILTRPAVEAGENLGFLPGDLKEKVDPYLRPIYDALYDCLGLEQVIKLMDKGIIEVAPLAYMRGRTLDDALIILDEAQNTTVAQMKMFLTRLGFKSKMIINGDITQIDLKNGTSGLVDAQRILQSIKEIGFIFLSSSDVVRHPLVQRIIDAYGKKE